MTRNLEHTATSEVEDDFFEVDHSVSNDSDRRTCSSGKYSEEKTPGGKAAWLCWSTSRERGVSDAAHGREVGDKGAPQRGQLLLHKRRAPVLGELAIF